MIWTLDLNAFYISLRMILNWEELLTPLEAGGALQRDLDKGEDWAIANCMKLNEGRPRGAHGGLQPACAAAWGCGGRTGGAHLACWCLG